MALKDFFNVFRADESYDSYDEQELMPAPVQRRKVESKKMSKINIVEPRVYSEVQSIADALLSQQSVLLNLRRVEGDQAQRIIDYLAGIAYAIGGDMQKLTPEIFLCTPANVEISGVLNDLNDDNLNFLSRP